MRRRLKIELEDSCKVWRSTGEFDQQGNEILSELLYEGECSHQIDMGGNMFLQGGQWYGQPMLYIPVKDLILEVNDTVEIRTKDGRVINAFVKQFRNIGLENMKKTRSLEFTIVWIRGGRDEQE